MVPPLKEDGAISRFPGSKATRAILWTIAASVLLAVAVAAYVVTYGPVSPFPTDQPISFAIQLDATTLELWYGCTRGIDSVDTIQHSDQVTVRIRGRAHSGDCASGHVVTLDEPLGDRGMIDGSTGERVEVQNRLVPMRP